MTEIIPSFKEELSNQTLPKLQCTETTEDGNNNKNGLLTQDFKFGLETVGTKIPIYSEDEMRKAKPDYLLVLPWHFIKPTVIIFRTIKIHCSLDFGGLY
jgi:hypothetical protein